MRSDFHPNPGSSSPPLPVQIEIYIDADGTVVFADLAEEAIGLAYALNRAAGPACEPSGTQAAEPGSASEVG